MEQVETLPGSVLMRQETGLVEEEEGPEPPAEMVIPEPAVQPRAAGERGVLGGAVLSCMGVGEGE